MSIEIELPEDVALALEAGWGAEGLPRKALEALAVEAYRSDVITAAQVGRMLGHSSRWETEDFLRRSLAYLDQDESDVGRDAEAVRQVSPR